MVPPSVPLVGRFASSKPSCRAARTARACRLGCKSEVSALARRSLATSAQTPARAPEASFVCRVFLLLQVPVRLLTHVSLQDNVSASGGGNVHDLYIANPCRHLLVYLEVITGEAVRYHFSSSLPDTLFIPLCDNNPASSCPGGRLLTTRHSGLLRWHGCQPEPSDDLFRHP
jgi:hypothetical protein